jgi:putative transposase
MLDQIPVHFPWTTLLDHAIMPDHIHGIIEIHQQLGRSTAAPLRNSAAVRVIPASLGAIVRSFKSAFTKHARQERGWKGELWQRNYFEKIVRPGQELYSTRAYIKENPLKFKWHHSNNK